MIEITSERNSNLKKEIGGYFIYTLSISTQGMGSQRCYVVCLESQAVTAGGEIGAAAGVACMPPPPPGTTLNMTNNATVRTVNVWDVSYLAPHIQFLRPLYEGRIIITPLLHKKKLRTIKSLA